MPIYTVPCLTIMNADFDVSYVLVTEVTPKKSDNCEYKRIRVLEELGRWSNSYYFHLFERHDLFESIKDGMKLKIKVRNRGF